MKKLVTLLLIITCSAFTVCAQSKTAKKTFTDKETGFQLSYPDSVVAVILKNNEDIKANEEPFVIEVYNQKQAKKLDSITGGCYKFDEVHKNKHKVAMKEFSCEEGAAGSLYYTFLYTIEKGNYTILIKFLHRHSDVYTDKKGKPVPFNKKKDMHWALDIIESVQFVKQQLKG
jgi:hypothetical protein